MIILYYLIPTCLFNLEFPQVSVTFADWLQHIRSCNNEINQIILEVLEKNKMRVG